MSNPLAHSSKAVLGSPPHPYRPLPPTRPLARRQAERAGPIRQSADRGVPDSPGRRALPATNKENQAMRIPPALKLVLALTCLLALSAPLFAADAPQAPASGATAQPLFSAAPLFAPAPAGRPLL